MKFDGKNILSMDGFFEIFTKKSDITKASKFTLEDAKRIGDQLNIDWTKIDQNEFLIGLNIELEHGTKFPETNVTDGDEIKTAKIVLAHINEYPDYYNEQNGLPEMEDRLKGIKKEKVYVDNPQEAPKDKKVQEGERGGLYYESDENIQNNKLNQQEYLKIKSELYINSINSIKNDILNKLNIRFPQNIKYKELGSIDEIYQQKILNEIGVLPPAMWDYNNKTIIMNPNASIYHIDPNHFKRSLLHEMSHVIADYNNLDKKVTLNTELKLPNGQIKVRPLLYNKREWIAMKLQQYLENKSNIQTWDEDEREEFFKIINSLDHK